MRQKRAHPALLPACHRAAACGAPSPRVPITPGRQCCPGGFATVGQLCRSPSSWVCVGWCHLSRCKGCQRRRQCLGSPHSSQRTQQLRRGRCAWCLLLLPSLQASSAHCCRRLWQCWRPLPRVVSLHQERAARPQGEAQLVPWGGPSMVPGQSQHQAALQPQTCPSDTTAAAKQGTGTQRTAVKGMWGPRSGAGGARS